jgi:hypothetical protein
MGETTSATPGSVTKDQRKPMQTYLIALQLYSKNIYIFVGKKKSNILDKLYASLAIFLAPTPPFPQNNINQLPKILFRGGPDAKI